MTINKGNFCLLGSRVIPLIVTVYFSGTLSVSPTCVKQAKSLAGKRLRQGAATCMDCSLLAHVLEAA